jgi:hypothetical protein
MRLFIKRVVFFAAVPLLLFIVSFIVNLRTVRNYKFGTSINKVIIGDSHTQAAINDSILHNSINFSNTSEPYIYTYYKLTTLIKNNPQIDTVMIGVGYHNFAEYYNDAIDTGPSRYVYFLPTDVFFYTVNHPLNNKNNDQYSLVIQKTLTYPFFKNARSIYGYYLPRPLPDTASEILMRRRINIQYYNGDRIKDFSTINIGYFNKIILLCKQKHKILIGLNTPLNKYYEDRVPLKFKTKYYQLTAGIKMIDFKGLSLSKNSFLEDGDHLTKVGAVRISVFLDSILKKH